MKIDLVDSLMHSSKRVTVIRDLAYILEHSKSKLFEKLMLKMVRVFDFDEGPV